VNFVGEIWYSSLKSGMLSLFLPSSNLQLVDLSHRQTNLVYLAAQQFNIELILTRSASCANIE